MNSEIECIKFGREGDKIIEEISDDKFNPVDFCKLFEKSGVKRIEYISKGRYFELSMGNIPVLDPNSGFIENMRFNEKLDSQEGKNFGWKVTLTNPNVRLNAQSIL